MHTFATETKTVFSLTNVYRIGKADLPILIFSSGVQPEGVFRTNCSAFAAPGDVTDNSG
jgi:hypothetical protein